MKTSPSDPGRGALRILFSLIVLLLAGGLQAQVTSPGSAMLPTGNSNPLAPAAPVPKVGAITVKFIGIANVSEQIVRANMQTHEGNDLDDAVLDRDIRLLYKSGLFEFIEIKREAVGDNQVNLIVEVTPKYRVQAIRFQGNTKIPSHRLEKEISSKTNSPLDERGIKEDSQKLYNYYQKIGYNQVSVSYTIDRNKQSGFCTVTFKVREGPRVKIADIRFVGNKHVKSRRFFGLFSGELQKQMETRRRWMFSWMTGSGRFKDDLFEDDITKLIDFYREKGFLDVEIPLDKVSYDYPKPNKLIITIRINEGRQYRVGDITFSGNKLYPTWLLRRLPQQKKGMIFAPSKLDKDREAVEDFYGRSGYLETFVQIVRKPNINTGNIDVEYNITEGEKFYIESIKVEGNIKTKSLVIIREINLGPGDVFDLVRMKTSKVLLENTRFFDEVNMTDEKTNIPGRRNLKISVREAHTGQFSFGAGFNSVEKASVFAEISQSNFDLFNRRGFFIGDGQKMKIRAELGKVSSSYTLYFEEPWLFQKRLALGFQIYRTSSDYNSSYYDEIHTGAQVSLRKYLFGLVEGTLTYTYEVVDIQNVDPTAPFYIQALAGKQAESRLGLSLVYDTRDVLINTTQGEYVNLSTEVAGGPFGGNVNYYKMELRDSQFFPIFETQTQVLAVYARGGVVESFGESNKVKPLFNSDGTPLLDDNGNQISVARGVPFYNLFFLGGPNDLRGFDYREVGPKDATGEPAGGKTYGMFSAEYSIDIVKPMRFAIFYDAGFVNSKAYDFNPVNYNDDFGFGIRLMMLGTPVALDYGIPLTADKINRKGNRFNFSFGTRF